MKMYKIKNSIFNHVSIITGAGAYVPANVI